MSDSVHNAVDVAGLQTRVEADDFAEAVDFVEIAGLQAQAPLNADEAEKACDDLISHNTTNGTALLEAERLSHSSC